MVSCDMYTIIKKVNYSNHTDFLICNRCKIDYDPDSNDHIDVYVNKMENRLFDTSSQTGDIYVFKSGCAYEWFGGDDIARCRNAISSQFGIDPEKISFLQTGHDRLTSKGINELFDKFSYKEENNNE